MNQIPNIEETHDTREVEETLSNIEDIIQNYHGNWPDEDEMGEILGELRKLEDRLHQQLQKAREEAVERIKAHGHKMKTAFNGKLPYVCWGENEENCRMSIYLKALDDTIKALQDNK